MLIGQREIDMGIVNYENLLLTNISLHKKTIDYYEQNKDSINSNKFLSFVNALDQQIRWLRDVETMHHILKTKRYKNSLKEILHDDFGISIDDNSVKYDVEEDVELIDDVFNADELGEFRDI